MHLTRHSDYSLRVLIFLAAKRDELGTIPEIANAYGISRAHLMKVVQTLAELGYIKTVRGRGGGLSLGMAPDAIRIGALIRRTEESLDLVDCFSSGKGARTCRITPACKLKGILAEALQAFFRKLDEYTLADIVEGRAAPLRRLLALV
jgi:Rrf2 family transcriptional regulator, nitric oxide-sensitive transcriptional repressor